MRVKTVGENARVIESGRGDEVARIIRSGGWRWTLRVLDGGYQIDVTDCVNSPDVLLKLLSKMTKSAARQQAESAFEQ